MSFAHRPTWLTPYKQTALDALSQGPLDHTPDGWVSRKGGEGCWNSHTIFYLKHLGYCSLNHGKTVAGITNKGRIKLGIAVDYAA